MKVVIVDDMRILRESIAWSLRTTSGWEVIEAGNETEAVDVIVQNEPDVVLLDIHLDEGSGFSVVQQIRLKRIRARIIFMSGYCTPRLVWLVEQARVEGFIDKQQTRIAAFREATEKIAAGGKYFSPCFLEMTQKRRADAQSFDKILSKREQEVLNYVAKNCDDREIAEQLGLAEGTVAGHRLHIENRLGVHGVRKLIRYAIGNGFGFFFCWLSLPTDLFDDWARAYFNMM